MLREIKEVPCQVVQADRVKQAAAYAAFNGNVTKITVQQLYHARLAVNETGCSRNCQRSALRRELKSFGVPQSEMKGGATQAINALTRFANLYGRETLITSFQYITQTADGNAGPKGSVSGRT